MKHTWTSCETSIVRQHQFYDSIRTVKNSNLEEEPDKETTSLPNCLRHVCNTPSSTRSTGKTKVSGLTVNTYPILIFADDIVLIANSTSKLQDMLQDIHDISKLVGLKMHLGKTKIMCNKHVNKDDVIVMERRSRRLTVMYILRQMVTKDHDQIQEMKRRIGQGWSAFCKLDNIMRDKNVPMRLKRKVFNECILPVMTYGCETWSLSNTQLEKLVTTQRKMERIMIGVTLKDRKSTRMDPEN